MAQKPVLRAEVYARALRASQYVKGAEVLVGAKTSSFCLHAIVFRAQRTQIKEQEKHAVKREWVHSKQLHTAEYG